MFSDYFLRFLQKHFIFTEFCEDKMICKYTYNPSSTEIFFFFFLLFRPNSPPYAVPLKMVGRRDFLFQEEIEVFDGIE